MYIIFIRKSWISSPSKNSLFMIRRLNHGWIWYCHNLRQNNSQICKFWNQQLYFQKLCLWDDQNSSESALLAETRPVTSIGCWGTQDPNQAARGLCFKSPSRLLCGKRTSKASELDRQLMTFRCSSASCRRTLICVSSIAIGRLRN